MSAIHLIDTSMWTCALRAKGDPASKQRVQELVRSGVAAWCPPVRLELWRGVKSEDDRKVLRDLEVDLPSLPIDDRTWDLSCRLADVGRRRGLQFPSPDLMIFACARQHRVHLVSRDKHFDQLAELWARLGS